MTLDHVALWTNQLEILKGYYVKYFNGRANKKYINKKTGFESYFISFDSGSRLEIMQKPGIPENLNDRVVNQHLGLIHLSFGVENMELVNLKSEEMAKAGFRILRGPRKTGDGYYEFETLDPDNNRIEVAALFVE
ncbi:MAG: VOC family protein [Bacteroidales bacterium]|nr:VOC family protein [Bacteroidales bacterium]MBK7625777.1 VOC family protein [Bacteroidales bacterium]